MKAIIPEIAKKLQRDYLAEKVVEIIAKQFMKKDIPLESSLQYDLGADSLDVLEIMMGLEEAFDIEIPDEDAEKIVTVKGTVEYVRKMKAGVVK